MKFPGLSLLKDKWVWIGLAAGAGVYLFTSNQSVVPAHHYKKKKKHHGGGEMGPGGGYSLYDRPGLYQVPNKGFENMRFSGQAELQRRLTVV